MHSLRAMRIAFLLGLLLGLSNQSGADTKRHFTVADDIGVAYFGDPYTQKIAAVTFSPDGRYFVVATQRGLVDQDVPESTLRVFRTEDVHQFLLSRELTDGPRPVWVFSKSAYKDGPIITQIEWLADSSAVAFLAKTAAGNDQLFLADVRTKTIDALTLGNQRVIDFSIRDRKNLVYSVESPAIREKAIQYTRQAVSVIGTGHFLGSLLFPGDFDLMQKLCDLSELWAIVKGKRFRVHSESSGRPLSLHADAQRILALSPDGRSVITAMAVRIVPPDWKTLFPPPLLSDSDRIHPGVQDLEAWDGFQYVSEYAVVDLSTGKVNALTNAPIGKSAGWWSFPGAEWSSDGKSVALINTFLSPTARDSQDLNRPCVAVVDMVTSEASCLERLKGRAKTKSGFEDGYHYIDAVHFSRGDNGRVTIDYRELNGTRRSTSYVRSNEDQWTVAATATGWAEQSGPIEVSVKESFIDPPVLVATDKKTKTSRVIVDPNPQLKAIDLGEASLYEWKDKNGRDWVGGLYKAHGYAQGRKYPLVIQTHGFYQGLFAPSGVFPTAFAARELAAAGIFVLQVPDCPVTVGPDEAACNVAGYEAGVEKLVADGVVDPERVGIVGFSRTCYYVLKALTTSTLHFRAASITDGLTFGYFEYLVTSGIRGNSNRREADGVIGAPPFGEGLQQWLKLSPNFSMDKVTTPLQVVALGRLSALFMWEPYATLRYLNKPVDLIMLRAGTHVLTNPAERMVSQSGTVDWFRFWLKDEEVPDPAKAEQYARWNELNKLQEESHKALTKAVLP